MLNSLLMLLQGSALGDMVRNAQYLYPVLEAIHILGIALLVGPAFAFDLRLLGCRDTALCPSPLPRAICCPSRTWASPSPFATGIALLSAQATVVASAGAAPWKFGLLILAGLNVPIFHYGVYRRVDEWADAAVTPIAARAAAIVSMAAWIGVILAGRLLAYT